MRLLALASVVIAFGHEVQAQQVDVALAWPDGPAPAAQVVSVLRDSAGTVRASSRQSIAAETRSATLPLPDLSRQATTVQMAAFVDGDMRLQTPRVVLDGGQSPESLTLRAALTASFTTDYHCDTGLTVALTPADAGFMLDSAEHGATPFVATGLPGRFIASDGTEAIRRPGVLQLEGAGDTAPASCHPIPTSPILPLTAQGPMQDDAQDGWRVEAGLKGSVVSFAQIEPPDAPQPGITTTITRQDSMTFSLVMGAHNLQLRRGPCKLPGKDMPFPYSADLTGPDTQFAPGCAGDPLHALEGAPWQITHLFGRAVPAAPDAPPAFTLQIDTGRLSGRTSCNRYLGRARVARATLKLRDLGTTRVPCPANLTNLETRFLDALEAATGIVRLPGRQIALYAAATPVLVARR